MAARGLVPATPKDLTLILYFLTMDEDRDVAEEARKTLGGCRPMFFRPCFRMPTPIPGSSTISRACWTMKAASSRFC